MKKHFKNLFTHCRSELGLLAIFLGLIAWSGAGLWQNFGARGKIAPAIATEPATLSLAVGQSAPILVKKNVLEKTKTPQKTFSAELPPAKIAEAPPEQEKKISVSLVLQKPGRTKTFKVALPDGSTVYDLLQIEAARQQFSLRAKDYSFGVLIEEIDGVANDTGKNTYWMLYVNEKLSPVGASAYALKDGDSALWRYQTPPAMD